MDEIRTAAVFKALCDENRIRILNVLKTGEKCACSLLDELSITQPTLSHHMRILCDSGIVSWRRDGKWMYYSISRQGSENAIKLMKELTEAYSYDKAEPCMED